VGAEAGGPAGSGLGFYISLPQGGGGHLTVDPSGVETLINYLEQARDKLRRIYVDARRLTQLEPPGDDPFSPIAVADIKRAAGEDPGGHLYANAKAQEVFQAFIDNLRASLVAYRESEAGNAARFRGGI
jgi:hypothetical protein